MWSIDSRRWSWWLLFTMKGLILRNRYGYRYKFPQIQNRFRKRKNRNLRRDSNPGPQGIIIIMKKSDDLSITPWCFGPNSVFIWMVSSNKGTTSNVRKIYFLKLRNYVTFDLYQFSSKGFSLLIFISKKTYNGQTNTVIVTMLAELNKQNRPNFEVSLMYIFLHLHNELRQMFYSWQMVEKLTDILVLFFSGKRF